MPEVLNVPLRRLRFGGTLFSYFVICPRKAWLFYYGLGFERGSELVEVGKVISESAYSRKRKEVDIDRTVVIDWIDTVNKVIHETKKSSRMAEAHRWQVKYYLYYLEQKGITGYQGMINYPREHKIEKVVLDDSDRRKIQVMLEELEKLLDRPTPPPPVRIKACSPCAYYEFCWV